METLKTDLLPALTGRKACILNQDSPKILWKKKFVSFLKYRTSWHYCGEDYVEEKAKFLHQV